LLSTAEFGTFKKCLLTGYFRPLQSRLDETWNQISELTIKKK
jgi:hypothetical protein